MGLIEKLKENVNYYKLDKYTKRRVSKSQFESRDRRYYENVYRDGVYVDPYQKQYEKPVRNYLTYKQSRWSLNDLLKKPSNSKSVATSQQRTSETYTLGRV